MSCLFAIPMLLDLAAADLEHPGGDGAGREVPVVRAEVERLADSELGVLSRLVKADAA